MPPKVKTVFFCTECGNETPKWAGQCPACRAWNTLVEQPAEQRKKPAARAPNRERNRPKPLSQIELTDELRFGTGMAELDRVLGGGAVQGSLVLVGVAPGIGKSTLMLQICDSLCRAATVLFVSGEKSQRQIKLRAQRLKVGGERLYLLAETDLEEIVEAVHQLKPDVLIADSIQTLYNGDLTASPGSVDCVNSFV